MVLHEFVVGFSFQDHFPSVNSVLNRPVGVSMDSIPTNLRIMRGENEFSPTVVNVKGVGVFVHVAKNAGSEHIVPFVAVGGKGVRYINNNGVRSCYLQLCGI